MADINNANDAIVDQFLWVLVRAAREIQENDPNNLNLWCLLVNAMVVVAWPFIGGVRLEDHGFRDFLLRRGLHLSCFCSILLKRDVPARIVRSSDSGIVQAFCNSFPSVCGFYLDLSNIRLRSDNTFHYRNLPTLASGLVPDLEALVIKFESLNKRADTVPFLEGFLGMWDPSLKQPCASPEAIISAALQRGASTGTISARPLFGALKELKKRSLAFLPASSISAPPRLYLRSPPPGSQSISSASQPKTSKGKRKAHELMVIDNARAPSRLKTTPVRSDASPAASEKSKGKRKATGSHYELLVIDNRAPPHPKTVLPPPPPSSVFPPPPPVFPPPPPPIFPPPVLSPSVSELEPVTDTSISQRSKGKRRADDEPKTTKTVSTSSESSPTFHEVIEVTEGNSDTDSVLVHNYMELYDTDDEQKDSTPSSTTLPSSSQSSSASNTLPSLSQSSSTSTSTSAAGPSSLVSGTEQRILNALLRGEGIHMDESIVLLGQCPHCSLIFTTTSLALHISICDHADD
ncbi:hypothetical protein DFP72DRAFT_1071280 [Ephemerocybe angulata]|uniref:Uncharacterized protein n=1 Tax=Ephemerocybe angulata TaxID=980116 RepID=A0A8H6M468_9AGAR|nr:hypothetical protein DFP72DRAFT_1071280 [Tulosesus angulatus]